MSELLQGKCHAAWDPALPVSEAHQSETCGYLALRHTKRIPEPSNSCLVMHQI
jgi:hypothetical protein